MIEWRLLILIGGMTSFGLAMQKSHAAEFLAELILGWIMPCGIYPVLSASLSFITPFEPACLPVYGPGGYRFVDLVKSGVVLAAIASIPLLLLVPRIWPL